MASTTTAVHPANKKHLTTVDKGIRDENMHALARRWKLAQSGLMDDSKMMQTWFPGQQDLFDILSVLTHEQVMRIADCSLPLFSLRLPLGMNDCIFKPYVPKDPFEAEAHEEVFLALVSRLDGLRTSPTSLAVLYDMSPSVANFLNRHSARELHAIAGDRAVVLAPLVADEFFMLASAENMTSRERTVLAGTTRRQKTN